MAISSIQSGRVICELFDWKASNLRLQKILYIACLNYIGDDIDNPRHLIKEGFEAWKLGPVQPELYEFCADFEAEPIKDVFPPDDVEVKHPKEYKMLEKAAKWGKDKSLGYLVGYTHRKGGAWDKLKQDGKKIPIPYSYIQQEYMDWKARDDARQ